MNEIFLTALEISAAASVIILLIALLSRIIDRKYTCGWKYWIWILIAVRLIIPFNPETEIFQRKIEVEVPNTVIYVPQENSSTEPESIVPSGAQNDAQNFEPSETIIPEEKPESKKSATLLDFLSAVWIGGAAILFLWNAGAYFVFRKTILNESKPASFETQRVLSEVKSSLGISENIGTVVCKNVKSPMIMGFLNPKLVLPSEDYPEDSLYFILRHELTHYRRKDTLYKAVLLLANAVHWFNPTVWLMRKLAGSDLEVSCDAQVIKGTDMEIRKKYSETILSCVHQEKAPCAVFSTHFYGGAKTLKKRFENILSTKKRKKGAAAFIFVLILALVLGGTVACTAGGDSKGAEEPSEEKIRELVLKANAVYQPGDETVFEIVSYENYIDEHYYNEIGNFYEAVPEIFSEAGIRQLFSAKNSVSFKTVFFEENGKIYCFSPMTDGDATNYYDVINSIILAQKRENFFRYRIEHSAKRKDGIPENFQSYVTIVFENGKYLVSDFDPIRYTFEEAPEISFEQQRAAEIYNSEKHDEYIARINQTIENHRSGTYVPMDNHHPAYPEDFPDAKNLPDADRNNVLIAWRNSVQLDESTVQDGAVDYCYIIDETYAIVFEPAEFVYADGTTSYGFANTGYVSENIAKWISETYDGYYGSAFENENAFENGTGFSINDIDTSAYDDVTDWGFMYLLSKTEGTREYKKVDGNGSGLSYLDEEPAELIWIVSKDGEFLNEDPFQKYGALSNHPDTKWWVYGIRGGILYSFYIDENTGEVTKEEPRGRNPQEFFGYTVYQYYWSNHTPYYGVLAPDGSDFAKPIYSRVKIPFEDRILLFSGNPQIMGLQLCQILNPEKEVLSESFNYANFSVFDDGSYFGIAFCGGNGVDGHRQTYDKNGNPMPDGYWFIDKNGTIVSERYESIFVNEEWNFDSESKDDMIIAVTAGGEKVSFPVRDILIED